MKMGQVTGLWLEHRIGDESEFTWDSVRRKPGNGPGHFEPFSFSSSFAGCLKVVSLKVLQLHPVSLIRPCIHNIPCKTMSITPNTTNMILSHPLSSRTAITSLLVLLLHPLVFTNRLVTMRLYIITNHMIPTSSAVRSTFQQANLPVKLFAWNYRRYKRLIWVESQYMLNPLLSTRVSPHVVFYQICTSRSPTP